MISDPDELGYRYPRPDECLWHEPSQRWVTVVDLAGCDATDEVPVVDVDGVLRTVKLRSLRELETPRPAVSPLFGLPYTVDPSGSGYRVEMP